MEFKKRDLEDRLFLGKKTLVAIDAEILNCYVEQSKIYRKKLEYEERYDSIHEERKRIKAARKTAVAIPDNLRNAPLLILIILWPIIAQPPIPPKKPVTIFAKPCARDSLLGLPRVSVISSIKLSVNKVSIKPIQASKKAYGKIIINVSKL